MYQEGRRYEIKSKKLFSPVIGTLAKIMCGVLVIEGTETPGVYGIKLEDVESYRVLGHANA